MLEVRTRLGLERASQAPGLIERGLQLLPCPGDPRPHLRVLRHRRRDSSAVGFHHVTVRDHVTVVIDDEARP